LRGFVAFKSEEKAGYEFYMELLDQDGKKTGALPIPVGSKHPEWIKALESIQKKPIVVDK
jgi:hypothetical protein